ncbi:MAG: hypothetical protein ACRCZI_09835 [Cetobacterium sp.]
MMDLENEVEEEFSLADIAGLDASEIAEVRFEVLPAGVYVFKGLSAAFEDTTNRDEERRIVLVAKMEVAEVKSVIDREFKTEEKRAELVGKKHTEKFYVVPAKAGEGLGLIRAFIGDIGLPNEGDFGGVPGAVYPEGHASAGEEIVGIVDAFVDHEFIAKIKAGTYNGNKTANLQVDKHKK